MFLFGKKKGGKRLYNPAKLAEQKRTSYRMPVSFEVIYILEGRAGRRTAKAIDLSSGGLRLISDEDFLRGSLLDLSFKLPEEFLEDMTVEKEITEVTPFGPRTEIVRVQPPGFGQFAMQAKILSPFFDKADKRFAFGMAFTEIEDDMREELQRFIHLWQLNFIRNRRSDLD
ncbi:MAG: PilZ domain-containing protein [Vulcanimicrobiaceae bacterium]